MSKFTKTPLSKNRAFEASRTGARGTSGSLLLRNPNYYSILLISVLCQGRYLKYSLNQSIVPVVPTI